MSDIEIRDYIHDNARWDHIEIQNDLNKAQASALGDVVIIARGCAVSAFVRGTEVWVRSQHDMFDRYHEYYIGWQRHELNKIPEEQRNRLILGTEVWQELATWRHNRNKTTGGT